MVPPCLRVRRETSPPDCFLIRLTPPAFTLGLDPAAPVRPHRWRLPARCRSAGVADPATPDAGWSRPDVHGQGLPATAARAEVRHLPVQADQAKQALGEASRLPRRHCRSDQWRNTVNHAKKDLHRQAGLRGVRRENSPPDCFLNHLTAVDRLSPPLACRLRRSRHVRIEPALRRLQAIAYRPMDRQRYAALERVCRRHLCLN